MRRRVTVMNEEYRCTERSFRCMPLHSEHAGDTNEAFQARFDAPLANAARRQQRAQRALSLRCRAHIQGRITASRPSAFAQWL